MSNIKVEQELVF